MFKRLKNLFKRKPIIDRNVATGKPLKVGFFDEEIGDGKAEFLGSGTEEEFIEQQRQDDGSKPWYDRIRNL